MKTKHNKVEIITKYFYPVAAGIETNILETSSKLQEMGWDITIHTSRDEYLKRNSLPSQDVVKNLNVKRYRFHNEFIGFIPQIDWMHTDIVCLHNFNVFFVHILLYSLWLKILGKKKFSLVLIPHGGFTPEWSLYEPLTKLIKVPYHHTIGKWLINTVVDKVRAVSLWEKKELIKQGIRESKIVTITNGIEDEAYEKVDLKASTEIKKKIKSIGTYIIQVGRIYQIKNYETVIRALPQIPKEIQYVIVGQEEKNTEYKQSLLDLATSLGVQDRVTFLGVVRGVDKYFVIRHALCMVHMAIWESFCNVVHEGLSQGRICLVADNTALPYLIRDGVNGFVLPTHDSNKLAETINRVYKEVESNKMKLIQKKNIEITKEMTWKNVAKQMNLLFENI